MTFARFATSAETQRAFAQHHGQPARIEAWHDAAIDTRFGGCYSATLQTMEQCWIRPRFPGYLSFQAEAGTLIERHLRGDIAQRELLDHLQKAFESCGRPGQ
jgi:multiple sugar transport system substrate-binding protein